MDASVTKVRPISIAILALGGEGGGVLADWIVDLAQHGGYLAQSTSIPGVAQRTGATIYYVELFPKLAAKTAGRDPVLSLVPMPGDVEIVLASELMEAARAVERGFVTPDCTLLIASTHRVYAMTEKIALGDGRADFDEPHVGLPRRRQPAGGVRHGGDRRSDRQRAQRGAVRRARRIGRAAVSAPRVRGGNPARRRRGRQQRGGVRGRVRSGARRRARDAAAPRPAAAPAPYRHRRRTSCARPSATIPPTCCR